MQTYGTVMFGWTLTILALWWFQHLRSKPGLSWFTSSWKMFHMCHFISAYFFLANMIFSIVWVCTTILDDILVYISLIFVPLVLIAGDLRGVLFMLESLRLWNALSLLLKIKHKQKNENQTKKQQNPIQTSIVCFFAFGFVFVSNWDRDWVLLLFFAFVFLLFFSNWGLDRVLFFFAFVLFFLFFSIWGLGCFFLIWFSFFSLFYVSIVL